MKINKLNPLSIAIFFLVAVLWSDVQGSEEQGDKSSGIPCLSKDGHMWLYRTNNPISVTTISEEDVSVYKTPSNEGREIIITTNTGPGCSQQLESDRFTIKRGEQIIFNYNITVSYGEIMFLFLDTNKNGCIDKTQPANILKEGENNGVYKTYVESDDTETSLAIRFYHTTQKQSKFTIKNIEIKKIPQRF